MGKNVEMLALHANYGELLERFNYVWEKQKAAESVLENLHETHAQINEELASNADGKGWIAALIQAGGKQTETSDNAALSAAQSSIKKQQIEEAIKQQAFDVLDYRADSYKAATALMNVHHRLASHTAQELLGELIANFRANLLIEIRQLAGVYQISHTSINQLRETLWSEILKSLGPNAAEDALAAFATHQTDENKSADAWQYFPGMIPQAAILSNKQAMTSVQRQMAAKNEEHKMKLAVKAGLMQHQLNHTSKESHHA